MIADTIFIPLGYSHHVLWLCHLLLSCGAVKRWPSEKAKINFLCVQLVLLCHLPVPKLVKLIIITV